ncbi:MAG: ketosteroid isomerase-like protein [Planctomycetota bacterium]|jgi:ketosteroid isomerase-like protein
MNAQSLKTIALMIVLSIFAGCSSMDSESGHETAVGANDPTEGAGMEGQPMAQKMDLSLMTDQELINLVMSTQQAAWNRGDIEAFMEGYWRSPDLLFTSGGRIRRGWQATLDGYKAGYTKETMGQLAFTDLEVVMTADNEAVVVGKWALSGLEKTPSGGFTLVFRKFLEGWRITRDHTTSD